MRTGMLWLALLTAPAVVSAQTEPRYLPALRAELQALGMEPRCAATSPQVGQCRVGASVASAGAQPGTADPAVERRFQLALEYSDTTDTVYLYLDHYAQFPADSANAPVLFRRMAEMNWEMLVGKFEWSPTSGELRLGAVLNTDSNFDRRAFRGMVRALLRLGARYADEFTRLTGGSVGELSAGPPRPPTDPTTPPRATATPIAGPRPAPGAAPPRRP